MERMFVRFGFFEDGRFERYGFDSRIWDKRGVESGASVEM